MRVQRYDGLGRVGEVRLAVGRGYLQRGRSPRRAARGQGWRGQLGVRGITLGVVGVGRGKEVCFDIFHGASQHVPGDVRLGSSQLYYGMSPLRVFYWRVFTIYPNQIQQHSPPHSSAHFLPSTVPSSSSHFISVS